MLSNAAFLFVVGMLLVGAIQLYSRRYSGINQHPYKHVHGGAPGAARAARMSGAVDREIRDWSRGTR
jgi:hypothetical protein